MPVARLALDLGITAYDASYVWLSRRLDAPLITLDLRLKRALG
ncbi:MAG: type II toxin-antitoxin system VapC family toxin [Thermoanaerobaculia bacterium]|nr:type II toxin-antitoxin system VapC family toxin [Thermoanaerobaculia bacterium]